jgi:hypothetical protein
MTKEINSGKIEKIIAKYLHLLHQSGNQNRLKKNSKFLSLEFVENLELFDTKNPRNIFSFLSFEEIKIFSCGFHH